MTYEGDWREYWEDYIEETQDTVVDWSLALDEAQHWVAADEPEEAYTHLQNAGRRSENIDKRKEKLAELEAGLRATMGSHFLDDYIPEDFIPEDEDDKRALYRKLGPTSKRIERQEDRYEELVTEAAERFDYDTLLEQEPGSYPSEFLRFETTEDKIQAIGYAGLACMTLANLVYAQQDDPEPEPEPQSAWEKALSYATQPDSDPEPHSTWKKLFR